MFLDTLLYLRIETLSALVAELLQKIYGGSNGNPCIQN